MSSTKVLRALAAAFAVFWLVNPAPTMSAEGGQRMKAIVFHEYGSADVLRLEDIEKPVPNDNQVLIKIRAAGANPLDWHYMRGRPYLIRMDAGLFKPKVTRLGDDVAGVVEAVGASVTQFKPGDEVFGSVTGAFAEYALAFERHLVPKPAEITFAQAAGVPIAAITALQGLRDHGRIQPGQKVLINGASGGVGTFAVQIAKSFGADVTGVCSTRNVEMVKSIGADHVVDYTKENFTESGQKYDLILDSVGNHSLFAIKRVLNPNGIYVLVGGGGPNDKILGPMAGAIKTMVFSPFVSQEFGFFLAAIRKDDLLTLNELMAAKKVTPVIDRTYPLSEAPAAIRYLEEGRARGKVIITVGEGE